MQKERESERKSCSRCGHLLGTFSKHRRVNTEECQSHLYLAKLMQLCKSADGRVLQHEWSRVGLCGLCCPIAGACITSYTKGPSSSWGADTKNGHTHWKTVAPRAWPQILTHCFEEHKAALADPMAAHTSASTGKQWAFSAGQHWESFTQGLFVCTSVWSPDEPPGGAVGDREGQRVSPLAGLLSQVVFN